MGKQRRERNESEKEKPSRRQITPLHFATARNVSGKTFFFRPQNAITRGRGAGGSRSPSDVAAAAAMTAAAAWPVCTICYEDLRPLSDQHLHCLPACGHVFHALWSVSSPSPLPPPVPFRSSNVWLDRGLSFRSPTRAAWSNGWSTARAERRSEPAPSASRPAAPRTRRPASTSSPPARARPRRDPPRRRIPPGDPTGRRSPTRSPAWSRRRRPSAGSSRSSGTASRTSMPRRAPLMSFSPDLCCVSRGLLRGYRCFFWSGCQVDGEGSLCGGVAGSREEGERLCQDAAPCENRGN